MPDQRKYVKKKYSLLSLYMHPWTLVPAWAQTHVPHIANLDVVPREHMSPDLSKMIRSAGVAFEGMQEDIRNHEFSWRSYIRGHVVSEHAKRLIVQFLAACCGRSSDHGNDDADDEDAGKKDQVLPDNDMSLQRIHALIDGMSKEEDESLKKSPNLQRTLPNFQKISQQMMWCSIQMFQTL